MKRRAITLFLTMAVALSAAGCGRANDNKNNTGTVDNTENQGEGNVGLESVMQNTETEADFNQLQLGNALELPEGFEGTEGETDAHGGLEKLIAGHLNIEENNYKSFRYYYNYVDLNGDSKDEILAMVLGESLNDQGGNRLLWIDASGSELSEDSILQEFQGVSAPVYISNHMTEGYRDLILCSNIGIDNGTAPGAAGTENVENGGTAGAENAGNDGTAPGAGNGENGSTAGAGNGGDGSTAGTGNGGDGSAAGAQGAGNIDTAGTDTGAGDNSGYVLLVWSGDKYQEISEGTVLSDLQGYEGDAVITNDLERDYREDTYHFLGEAMNL